jgi:hypothetical protein
MILPPHITHQLQPLDVGLFLPLSTFFSQEITNILHGSEGVIGMTKRFFWNCFKKAWQESFTEENITSAFKKTGI